MKTEMDILAINVVLERMTDVDHVIGVDAFVMHPYCSANVYDDDVNACAFDDFPALVI